LLADAPTERTHLLEYLHRVHDVRGYLDAEQLAALAEYMGLSAAEVFEVATFYHHFQLVEPGVPPAPLTIRVCDSIVCDMFGAKELLTSLEQAMGDGVRVVSTSCIGRCQKAPAVLLGRNPVVRATPKSVQLAMDTGRTEEKLPAAQGLAAYREDGGYAVWEECLAGERAVDDVIRQLELADLRGLGGAGFRVARKWELVREHAGPRILAVNADEGEPGTFKDRHCLETEPHRMLEGALIAAWVVEASEVYIYLRDEYAGIHKLLVRELDALRVAFPESLPTLHLRRGAGSYVCGEESAMLESMEGQRGMPRLRPPYVAETGLFGRPTLVHNVETLFQVPEILIRGAGWYAAQGAKGRRGRRHYSISGRVKRPGVYLAPLGVTARELINNYAHGMAKGHTLYAYLPGGAAGGILPASLADSELDPDSLSHFGCFLGSAGLIVLSEADSARDVALNAMRFFARESCGKCTPCRVGTQETAKLMAAAAWDLPRLRELAEAMEEGSICGLGQAASNALRCVVTHFPHELS